MANLTPCDIDSQLLRDAAKRTANRCDRLAEFSDEEGRITRTFCSPAMERLHAELSAWMTAAKLECEVDAVGNLIGKSPATASDEVFLIGSHLDTVINAGRFDGVLGVLLGLAVAEVFNEAKIELPFSLQVIGFSEEEGVRYRFPFIGSRGITGSLPESELDRVDANGSSVRSALDSFGCGCGNLASASYEACRLVGFMEAHIEQAVVLEEASLPVGVVTTIAGQTRARIVFDGVAGHAGTVPHDRRRDALAAAAELILKIESLGQNTDGLFATIGCIDAKPGLSNVIAGTAELRLDLRHEVDPVREAAFDQIQRLVDEIAGHRQLAGRIDNVEHTPAVQMDQELTSELSQSVVEVVSEAKSMVSGAGHDAMILTKLTATCLLFIRCHQGISHHPDETVSLDDIEVAINVMVKTILRVGHRCSVGASSTA
ncbi:Hydantoin utilization protein C [Rubripirellula obstinata]|uniref:Hydantoin utilization protein C n=1 Tax=Rubripirellula obstinata TaxID=406547 RepID=A0A5B1CIH8_9BACT|nr:Zn-dependent hydrolase [Rubripirellula obstinata]KAA1259529.1 Hydantoin utilization protein C [Rubripirellula obstinata]